MINTDINDNAHIGNPPSDCSVHGPLKHDSPRSSSTAEAAAQDGNSGDRADQTAATEANPSGSSSPNPWMRPGEKFNYQSMGFFQRLWGHFKTITTHKYHVAYGCFKVGLYYQGLVHDLSKYSPTEFFTGVRYFDGHRSPNSVERACNEGCCRAWLHHKGRNKHHFEYWIDYSIFPGRLAYGNRMPMRYVAEMLCDRWAACITYNGKDYNNADALNYYMRSKDHLIMDRDTRIVLENCLTVMRDEGEDACFAFVRKLLSHTKGRDYTAESLGLKDLTNAVNPIAHIK